MRTPALVLSSSSFTLRRYSDKLSTTTEVIDGYDSDLDLIVRKGNAKGELEEY